MYSETEHGMLAGVSRFLATLHKGPFMKHALKMDLFGDTRIATAPSNLAPRDHRTEAGNGELRANDRQVFIDQSIAQFGEHC
jgi:hypothetical protein